MDSYQRAQVIFRGRLTESRNISPRTMMLTFEVHSTLFGEARRTWTVKFHNARPALLKAWASPSLLVGLDIPQYDKMDISLLEYGCSGPNIVADTADNMRLLKQAVPQISMN